MVIFPEYLKRRNRVVISALARTPGTASLLEGDTNYADKEESCLCLTLMSLTSLSPSTTFFTITYSAKILSSTALEIGIGRQDLLYFILLLSLIDFSQAEHVSGREQTRFCSFLIDLPDLSHYVS